MPLTQKQRKLPAFAAWILFGILGLAYRMLLWNGQSAYLTVSREICSVIGLNRDLEWRRFCSVLCHFQGLPFAILSYFLLVKFQPRNTKTFWLRFSLCIGAMLVTTMAYPRVAGYLFPSYRNPLSPNHEGYVHVIWVCIFVGLLLLGCALLQKLLKARLPALKALPSIALRWGALLGISFLIAVAYGIILNIVGHFAPDARQAVIRSFTPDTKLYAGILTMSVMAPVAEELVFRGLLMSKLRRYSNVWTAVILSSILFGLWHRNLGQLFPTFCMGIIFSWVYLRTGKLRHAMVVHSLSNTVIHLSLCSKDSILPYIPFMVKLKDTLLALDFWVTILLLLCTIGVIFALIRWVLTKSNHT